MRNSFNKILNAIEKAKSFGYSKLADGTQLYGKIPHAGTNAWLHAVFAPLDISGLDLLEKHIGMPLPPTMKDLFLEANGLDLFSSSLSIDGLRKNYKRTIDEVWQPYDIRTPNVEERPPDSTLEMVFIGGYNWDGSLLYINNKTERIFRCSASSAQPLNEWKNIWTMMIAEINRLRKHFDNNGNEINSNTPTIPV